MSSFKNEEFDNEISYRERLTELVINNYEILTHGYQADQDIWWIRYYVREYKR